MYKLFRGLMSFALRQRLLVILMALGTAVYGFWAFLRTPIEAFPDVTNTQIIIVTQWPGRSTEEVERFITIPIEISMNAVQRKVSVRSVSMFGLSIIKVIFEDEVTDDFARPQVNNLLRNVSLPAGAESVVQPPYGPTGEIYRYTLKSNNNRSSRYLLTIQEWVIDRQLRSVPGVADIVSFGGERKVFEIAVNPQLLDKYELTPIQVYQAVQNSNVNVGGDVIEKNGQAYVVRGIGLISSVEEIGNIIIDHFNNTPVMVKHVAEVRESALPRVGQAGLNENSDVVEGIVVMRKDENPTAVLARVKETIQKLNDEILPRDVHIETFYDRDVLINFCKKTVLTNLIEGIVLVSFIVYLFMADWRTTLIIATIIPLSLLFAFICLRIKGMNANLLSLGAVDFGIIIDGAVVMVESVFVALDHKAKAVGMGVFNKLAKRSIIKRRGSEIAKSVFFGMLIMITALVPILAFERVEGKMFSPLAYTLGFALLGALIFTMTLVPTLMSFLLNKNVHERHNVIVETINRGVYRMFCWVYPRKKRVLISAISVMGLVVYSFSFLGSEFIPHLNEGALWVEAKLPMSASLKTTVDLCAKLRKDLQSFEEVQGVLSQTGRSNDGTDPSGFYYIQCQVNLKPKDEWPRNISYEQLIDEMDAKLSQYQGVVYNYSQPIIDNVAEAVAGINANLAVKIFGRDMGLLEEKAKLVADELQKVEGISDLGVIHNLGQPELSIHLDENKMAAYGVSTANAQAVIEMAIGGKAASQLFEGERKFDIRIRYLPEFRNDEQNIGNLKVPTIHSRQIPLKEIAKISYESGSAFIYRDNNRRFIAVKFTIRGRDLGSTIEEAQARIQKTVPLPKGYAIEWTGEFESKVRATKRLQQILPLSMILIFGLLFTTFGNVRDAILVLLNVPFAIIGGILALHMTGQDFSIAAGVGFIAVFGICVQNGVLLVTAFKQHLQQGYSIKDSLFGAIRERTRPVVMTATIAAFGLLPAALSTGIGSEAQKPLAIVVIGSVLIATQLTLLVFPLIIESVYNRFGKH